MCKIIFSCAVLLFFISCGSKQTSTSSNEQTNNTTSTDNMLAEKMDRGKVIYDKTCMVCHQATGAGVPKSFPPLASSDYLNADVNKVIDGLLQKRSHKEEPPINRTLGIKASLLQFL